MKWKKLLRRIEKIMENFNQKAIDSSFIQYSVGSVISGSVVLITKDGIVLNIGGKKDAFIYNEDIVNKEKIKVGDVVKGIIKESKDENGFVKISQTEFEDKKKNDEFFKTLTIGKVITIIPTMVTSGGLIAKFKNFNVFVPLSHIDFANKKNPSNYINKEVDVNVIQVDAKTKKIIGSIKQVVQQKREQEENELWSKLQEGLIVDGEISSFTEYGAFVNVYGKKCLILNKDTNFFNQKASDVFKEKEVKQFIILNADREHNKVLLGYKQLMDDPRIALYKKYVVGKNYIGKVVKVFNYGVVVKFEENVSGFLHISDAEYGLVNMQEMYKVGNEIKVKIKDIDVKNHKISLERKYDYEYECE
jgi:small subunit ribosomal protein S1